MSRTYRRHSITDDYTENEWINRDLAYRRRLHDGKRLVRKRDPNYQQKLEAYNALPLEERKELVPCTEWQLKYWCNYDHIDEYGVKYRWTYKLYPPRAYYYVREPYSEEEQIADARAEYAKFGRDGQTGHGKRKVWFRHDCARSLRRRNKDLCNRVIKGDYDHDEIYPDRDQDKYKVWCWW